MVKGKTHKVAEESATQLLNLYELKDKSNEYYESLGNMDRKKFSIALSRAGDPKVILYFKPTAGFSEGTQDIWNQILLEASSRTIILATDNFEEAEYLADRIAIFDKGYLRCYGTPMFIKSSYKTGYLLRIQKEADYQESIISQLINRYLPNSSLQVNLRNEAHYLIPVDNVRYFPDFFNIFESQKINLGIRDMQITETSLERVYNTLKSRVKKKLLTVRDLQRMLATREFEKGKLPDVSQWKIFKLLLHKNKLLSFRRYWNAIFLCLLPIIITVMTCWKISSYSPDYNSQKTLNYNMSTLDGMCVFYKIQETASPDVEKHVRTAIAEAGATPIKSYDIEEDLLLLAREDLGTYRDKHVFAIEWKEPMERTGNIVLRIHGNSLFDNAAYMGQVTAFNILLKQFVNDRIVFDVPTHPHIRREFDIGHFIENNRKLALLNTWVIPMGLILFLFSRIEFPIQERLSGFRHQQSLAGVKFWTYWASLYLCDICLFMTLTCIVCFAIYLSNSNFLRDDDDIGYFLLSFFFSGSAILSVLYFASFYCSKTGNFVFFAFLMSIISDGAVMYVWDKYINTHLNDEARFFESGLHYYHLLWHMSPIYILTLSMFQLQQQQALYGDCEIMRPHVDCKFAASNRTMEYDCCESECLTEGCSILYLLLRFPNGFHLLATQIGHIIIFTTLIACKELNILNRLHAMLFEKDVDLASGLNVDPEIYYEKETVQKEINSSSRVTKFNYFVYNMTKIFDSNIILRCIDLTVTSGESIVICGASNSGKSLILQILAGLVSPSQGNMYMYKQPIYKNRSFHMSNIGYCPYNSALSCNMTAYESLLYFAKLHGYSGDILTKEVEFWFTYFSLKNVQNELIQNMVTSDLLKLNLAVVFMKWPTLILLDDPMTLVEENDRESVYLLIESIKKSGQSIILTTGSKNVDHISSICTKTAILYKGQLQCLASYNSLRQRFGFGNEAIIKLKTAQLRVKENAINSLKDDFTSRVLARLMYHTSDTLYYHIRDPNLKLTVLFTHLEQLKEEHDIIEEYNVAEISLYDNFFHYLNFRDRIDVASTMKAARARRNQMEAETKSTFKRKKVVTKFQYQAQSLVTQRPPMRSTCVML